MVVFIDDGSSDGRVDVIRNWRGSHASIQLIRFRPDWGLTAALHAGFVAARGAGGGVGTTEVGLF